METHIILYKIIVNFACIYFNTSHSFYSRSNPPAVHSAYSNIFDITNILIDVIMWSPTVRAHVMESVFHSQCIFQ